LAFHRVGRHTQAIEDLSRAISLRPEAGSTYIRRWQVYKEIGDETRAAQDFQLGTKLLPRESEPDGAANRSQPAGLPGDRTSAAAGSGG
jgi:tetratricopeptide (TPR) repeat protein